jgi:phenylpyruvate tautomerase PptA (4-oxalocrotonate tautomerase family)
MPLMFLNYTEGTFTQDSRDKVVNELTRAGVHLENLPLTEYVLSTTWVYTREYPKETVYNGGKPVKNNFIGLEINVIQGGYSASTKRALIETTTDALEKYGNLPAGEPRRVYVVIREVSESNWGFDGKLIDLQDLRNPPTGLTPL